jgi:hypothetical protein
MQGLEKNLKKYVSFSFQKKDIKKGGDLGQAAAG